MTDEEKRPVGRPRKTYTAYPRRSQKEEQRTEPMTEIELRASLREQGIFSLPFIADPAGRRNEDGSPVYVPNPDYVTPVRMQETEARYEQERLERNARAERLKQDRR